LKSYLTLATHHHLLRKHSAGKTSRCHRKADDNIRRPPWLTKLAELYAGAIVAGKIALAQKKEAKTTSGNAVFW